MVPPPSTPRPSPPPDAGRRRRRPSGEPPPLPRDLRRSGRYWAALTVGVLFVWFLVGVTELGQVIDRLDHAVLREVIEWRRPSLDRAMRRLQVLGAPTTILVLRWFGILTALVFRRFRQLLVFLGCILLSTAISAGLQQFLGRSRPLGVRILGDWTGFSHPSRPMVDIAVCLIGLIYLLVPRGEWRSRAKFVAGGYIAFLALIRLYLAVDHPTDILFGVILGVTIALMGFRLLAPTDVFPITYRRGRSAHLDVGGPRGEAIKAALSEQLGLPAVDVRPFGLDGSAGSTPLRIALADPDAPVLFGKLYAATHLRSDRWYKLGRTLLYGRLEDESTFSTVRRLVQYEDYLLHIMGEAGIPTARPYGFAEITPEREYVIVTEFFEGAEEISKVDVDVAVIDDALGVVRCLWEAGLAHRDIKPANVLVRDGKVLLIDVAFGEVRPSPWRQAVDLANMMLVLALQSDADTVYERAQRLFTPDEIAEAFAATRGLTLTSQLRSQLRQDGRDLIAKFRALAPERAPIKIQRWSLRRVALTSAVLIGSLLAFVLTISLFAQVSLL
ncbi:MAG TPA: phosphatase PAP2 family protein [Acidimicrobiales bacterium]|nr:phosphatase PAP2 family protein [Acidimicrobiales bacterium]